MSGIGTFSAACTRAASAISSGLVGQRRYTVVLWTPAREATVIDTQLVVADLGQQR